MLGLISQTSKLCGRLWQAQFHLSFWNMLTGSIILSLILKNKKKEQWMQEKEIKGEAFQ